LKEVSKTEEEKEEVGFDELLKAMEEADAVTDHPECTIDNPECETCSG